ncbi:MAG: hypothetical protein GWP91_11370 [Rhodobacterales bacterium]|nr:hypothetical protein [Rhodobacterales bacterium]
MSRITTLLVLLAVSTGCRKEVPEADEGFSDALRFLFRSFNDDEETVAAAMRTLEEQVYVGMDVEAKNASDRALLPEFLEADDVVGLEHPGRDLKDALPVAVAGISPHNVDDARKIQLHSDHTVVEPYSPNYFVRTWYEGEDCWLNRECLEMKTTNDVTKDNLLMTVDYTFEKDFRWINMADEGAPRWAYVGRSWTTDSFEGQSGKVFIHQSFTIEFWVPRDGRGFIRDGDTQNLDGGEWTSDSSGGGTLRLLSLWGETQLDGINASDETVIATTRNGIDKNFTAQDQWLDEN